ncbi:MAG: tetratricopeptide repeat protein [Methylovulum sp.]|nr:tetratricopeptide repeat protein [Methylovulum sp.]
MAQAITGRCTNRVGCDLALRNESIEIPQDGKCPECRQPLQPEAGQSPNATNNARRKRNRLIALGGSGALILCVAVLLWGINRPSGESLPIDEESLSRIGDAGSSEPVTPSKPEPVTPSKPDPNNPSLEAKQYLKHGMDIIALAKQSSKFRSENIRNALNEFNKAAKQEESQGRCYGSAYMNRGLAYLLDNRPNLAEKDLIKASECDARNSAVFYNLAAYYSVVKKTDLAIEALDKALTLGFDNCDVLRRDTDLRNLSRLDDFRRTLEKHRLFCLR